jgi:hypothetical protein
LKFNCTLIFANVAGKMFGIICLAMAKIKSPEKLSDLPLSLVTNMVMLATSGFGVVVALAWNEAVKAGVATYIDPYLGKSSGVVSLIIYALLMTFLAVMVTMQLTFIQKKLEEVDTKVKKRKSKK